MAILRAARYWIGSLRYLLILIGLAVSSVANVHAEILEVGTGQRYKMPSDAAAVARDGDTIAIDPGEYFDCAVWRANRLTITGTGPQVIVKDKSCNGKGLFVIDGSDVTVMSLTLMGARVPNGNGAGIRAEGVNLKVKEVTFLDDQNGILANSASGSTIEIDESEFIDDGTCVIAAGCGHGIYIGHIKAVRVTNSRSLNPGKGTTSNHARYEPRSLETISVTVRRGRPATRSIFPTEATSS